VLWICEIARCDRPKLQRISGNWVENVLFQFGFRAAKLLEPTANAPGNFLSPLNCFISACKLLVGHNSLRGIDDVAVFVLVIY
jgi:hypothetical protein